MAGLQGIYYGEHPLFPEIVQTIVNYIPTEVTLPLSPYPTSVIRRLGS